MLIAQDCSHSEFDESNFKTEDYSKGTTCLLDWENGADEGEKLAWT